MASWLHNLRKKPKHVRDNIALGSSAGLTVMVALVWFVAGGSPDTMTAPANNPGFFQTFKEGFSKQMAAARESIAPPTASTTARTTTAVPTVDMAAAMNASTTASSSSAKPVLIEIINASTSATSSSSTSPR